MQAARFAGVSAPGEVDGGRGPGNAPPVGEVGGYGNPGRRSVEVEVVRAIYAAFARRDVEAALAHVAEDITFFPQSTAARVGRTTPYAGHEGVREYFADAAKAWDNLTLHAEDMRAAAGGVVVFGRATGVAGGQRVERRVVWTWQVRDGKARSMRVSDLGEVTPS